jgi:hypothetical protein
MNAMRRCQVGLHNYQFTKSAKTKDQNKELLVCRKCKCMLLPSDSRQCYEHEPAEGEK